jgi:uncharacterized OB-fold protein
VAITRADFPLPDVHDPLTAPFFAAAARGALAIPRCATCDRFVWYPESPCPGCGRNPEWTDVSGRGSLFSWAVVRRPFLPAFAEMVPFVTGLVALTEDPAVRVATLVVGSDPDSLVPDAPVRAVFRPLAFPTVEGSVVVPMFEVAS